VSREGLEVADVFRHFGPAFRDQHGASLSAARRRAMTAIESCRTAALGGHVDRCDECGHQRVSYDSCLMGKFSNGELAYRQQHFSVNCSALCLHNSAVLCLPRLGH
jgi:Transposase zinc-binding domain